MAPTLLLRAPNGETLRVELDSAAPVSTTATDARFVGGTAAFGGFASDFPTSNPPPIPTPTPTGFPTSSPPPTGFPTPSPPPSATPTVSPPAAVTTYTLQMGLLGFQEVANEAVMPATVVDRFVVDGREVRLAAGVDGYNATAALIDQWHEAMLVYAGPPPDRGQVIEALQQFSFEDSPEGMVVRARPGTGLELLSETTKIVVEERGAISVPGPGTAIDMVPRHAGARTAYGAVWRLGGQLPDRPGDGANTYVYIVGTSTALAGVIFDFEPTVDDPTLLAWLETINLAWL
ncbi:MAG TPA: hypothetical protein VFC19_11230 [Candidatus Limnocylindrales bacterium]|nr:hypothetical protein [Candidatus Limnocylindrales bacterium]